MLISFAITKLISAFVFAYAKCWFSHYMAHMVMKGKIIHMCHFHQNYHGNLVSNIH